MADDDATRPHRSPGLSSRGNRILLAVAVGWIGWFFANLLDAPTAGSLVLGAVVAAITYAITTAAVQR